MRSQQCRQAILHRATLAIVRGSVRRAQVTHVYIPLRTRPFRRTISLCGAPHVPDVVLLARRPYRPYRDAIARGTLALPDGCAAVHRSGSNSSVLAVPRSMCVRTLSKYLPSSRSILSALATSDIKLALRIPCAQRSDEQPVLAPYRMTSVACIVCQRAPKRGQARALSKGASWTRLGWLISIGGILLPSSRNHRCQTGSQWTKHRELRSFSPPG